MVSHEAPSTSELLLIVKPNVYLVRPQVLQTYGFSERMWTTLRRKWKGGYHDYDNKKLTKTFYKSTNIA
jgi:hypothetical protein